MLHQMHMRYNRTHGYTESIYKTHGTDTETCQLHTCIQCITLNSTGYTKKDDRFFALASNKMVLKYNPFLQSIYNKNVGDAYCIQLHQRMKNMYNLGMCLSDLYPVSDIKTFLYKDKNRELSTKNEIPHT